jgi:hypothetical protein
MTQLELLAEVERIVNEKWAVFSDPDRFLYIFTAAGDDPSDHTSEGWKVFTKRGNSKYPICVRDGNPNETIPPSELIDNGFTRDVPNLFSTSNVTNNYHIERLLHILLWEHPGRAWRKCGGEHRVKKIGEGKARKRVLVEGLRATALITRADRKHGYHSNVTNADKKCKHALPKGLWALKDKLHRAWCLTPI